MAPRRRRSVPDESPANGDLATYSRFRDKLLLASSGVILALVGFVVQDQIRGKSHNEEVVERRLSNAETDQRQFKDRVNAQFEERARLLSGHGERIKGVESEQVSLRGEILRRLDRIEEKLH